MHWFVDFHVLVSLNVFQGLHNAAGPTNLDRLRRGRSAQAFRDPEFLGIVNLDNDAVYLPLKKGSNELMLAVSELGGGWGFICRLEDLKN